jgi:hypothetical protein
MTGYRRSLAVILSYHGIIALAPEWRAGLSKRHFAVESRIISLFGQQFASHLEYYIGIKARMWAHNVCFFENLAVICDHDSIAISGKLTFLILDEFEACFIQMRVDVNDCF